MKTKRFLVYLSSDACLAHTILLGLVFWCVACCCSCVSLRSARADLKAADAYIKVLEDELERIQPCIVDDGISGRDEYYYYYQNK